MAGLGTGTTIALDGSDAGDIFAEIYNIKLPSLEGGRVDVSHMSTVSYRTYLAKELLDVGEMEVEGNFNPDIDPADYVDASDDYTITFPSGATWAFTGRLSKYDATVPNEDKMTVTMSFVVETGFTVTAA